MVQTGHRRGATGDIAALPAAYFHLEPTRAFVNGEPWYENHPSRDVREVYGPAFTAEETRYAFWVSMLSGATMGHTYGAQGIWNWKRPGDDETELAGPQIGPPWHEALGYAGAEHCAIGARLLRSLPWWRLRPCPERVALAPPAPDLHRRPFCARVPGELYLAYAPSAEGNLVLKGLEEGAWRARWIDPRDGTTHELGALEMGIERVWRAPTAPSPDDWLLMVLKAD